MVDLAAGTGKLTRALVPTGATVVAVEPVAEMRALIEGVEALDGRAEAIPLPDGSADAVTVGQAFHWFATDAALAEIHRVLRPGGALGLIWNSRDDEDELQRAITDLIHPLAGDVTSYYGDAWREPFGHTALFGPLEEASFPQSQELDEQGLVDRFLSVSYIASATEEQRAAVEARLRALARERGGRVTLPYVTSVHVTRRR